MSGYILAVAGAVLLFAALSAILPSGKMGEFLKGMCRLVMLAVIVAPLISMLTKRELSLPAGGVGTDVGYLAACAELLSERDEREIGAFLEENYALSAEAVAERDVTDGFPLRKITVKLSANGIIGQEEHINMAEHLEAALKETFHAAEVEILWES